jgi:Terminase RNaseH-like domain
MYKIKTREGYKDFAGVLKGTRQSPIVEIYTTIGVLRITQDHILYKEDGTPIESLNVLIGDKLIAEGGVTEVTDIKMGIPEDTYELIGVASSDNTYYLTTEYGNVLTHNCDELDFVQPNISKDFWTSIQPTLSTGGSCIVTSTPKNEDGVFADIWNKANHQMDEYGNPTTTGLGINGFRPLFYTWKANPTRDDKWKKTWLGMLGPTRFRQEMECEFITDEETLIDSLFLKTLKGQKPIAYTGQTRWFSKPRANHVHLVSLDPCKGTGGDYAAIQVFEAETMTQVAEWQHNKTPIKGQIKVLKSILEQIYMSQMANDEQADEPEIYWTVENNSIGEAALVVIEDTGEHNFYGTFISEKTKGGKKRKGMWTSNSSKLAACMKIKSLIETRRMTLQSEALIVQLKNYQGNGASYSAKSGANDDLVAALLLITRLLQTIIHWLSDVEDLTEIITEDEDDYPLHTSID